MYPSMNKENLKIKFLALTGRVDATEADIDKLYMTYLSIKEELKDYAKKDDLIRFKDDIIAHIDAFTKKFVHQDTEITSLKSGYKRHDKQITKLAKHSNLSL